MKKGLFILTMFVGVFSMSISDAQAKEFIRSVTYCEGDQAYTTTTYARSFLWFEWESQTTESVGSCSDNFL
jgi:hypothetical protein